jgi:MFS transporter, FSR family, fosmidomycin resistance protein
MKSGINKLGLGVLAFGHMVTDMQTSALSILIPILYANFSLDYAGAGLIIALNSLTSSIIQPVFGLISDKRPLRWLLPLGTLLCAGGMVLVVFMPTFWLALLVVVVSGLGSAAFHPEGSRNANYVSGDNKATGLSFFFVGGNLGFALGPVLVVLLLGAFGNVGIFGLLIPGLLGAGLMWWMLPRYAEAAQYYSYQRARAKTTTKPITRQNLVKNLSILLSIISIRSMLQTGLVTFIPLYFIAINPNLKDYAATLLSIFLLCGAVGTIAGGWAADKIGRKTVMVGSLLVVTPLLFLFLNSSGAVQMISIGLAGGTLIAASSLTVVMAQETLPNSIGLASGLTLGLGFGAGGLGAILLGVIANGIGLNSTMVIIALLPLPVVLLSLLMPNTRQKIEAIEPTPAQLESAPPQTELANARG